MIDMKLDVKIPEINFGTLDYAEKENKNSFTVSILDVKQEDYLLYIELLKKEKFKIFEKRVLGVNYFTALKKGNDAVYLSYYPSISEMRIIVEKDSAYINYSDQSGTVKCQSSITQINLEDFGLSYVIQLSDGRFIVIDGGWHWEIEADKLMNHLKEHTDAEKPIIAAWILSHPHCDHYWCFVTFCEKYKNDVTIEKILFNFSDPTDEFLEKVPGAFNKNPAGDCFDYTIKMFKYAKESGAELYCPHTGQVYVIGNARVEFLSSPDDTMRVPVKDANILSLIFKMTIYDQTILWFTDGYFKPAKLVERYGSYLKSDIMQLPHHGFVGGTAEGYDAVNPDVCLASTFECDMFAKYNIYKDHNYHLLTKTDLNEIICGKKHNGKNTTITLPYTPRLNSRKILNEKIKDGFDRQGARVWYFDGLMLDGDNKCLINIINTSYWNGDAYIDLFFEDIANNIEEIKVEVKSCQINIFNLNNINLAENNPTKYMLNHFMEKEIAKGKRFCAKIYCDKPIVVSTDCGKEIYHY